MHSDLHLTTPRAAWPRMSLVAATLWACTPELSGKPVSGDAGSAETTEGSGPSVFDEPAEMGDSADASGTLSVSSGSADAGTVDAALAPLAHDASAPAEAGQAMEDGSALPMPLPVDSGAGGVDGGTGTTDAACAVNGRYAVDLRFNVSWKGTTLAGILPLIREGSGQIRVLLVADLNGPLDQGQGTLRTCAVTLPDFATENALVSERYNVYFRDEGWDSASMPTFPFAFRHNCAEPGCSLVVEQALAIYGAAKTTPGEWPARDKPITSLTVLDHDADGFPAVSAFTRGPEETDALGEAYSHPPVSWTLGARATQLGLGMRVAANLSGTLVQCGLYTGAVSQADVDARSFTCRALSSNSDTPVDCTQNQATFIDQATPAWTVTGGDFQAVHVDATTSCARVRELFRVK